jgi:hypothetical protein
MTIEYKYEGNFWILWDESDNIGTFLFSEESKNYWFNPSLELMYSESDLNTIGKFLNYVNTIGFPQHVNQN